jgi:anti-sigma regulatory factor (Ser/Thr protein kinase)
LPGVERVETQFPSVDTTPASVRGFLRAALQTWELDGFGNVTELLSDELVSNVVRHVGSPMTVRVLRKPSSIRVEVDDPSPDPPVIRRQDLLDEHGRGILLLDALASQWGVIQHDDDGKTVWFEIDVTTATEEIHGD